MMDSLRLDSPLDNYSNHRLSPNSYDYGNNYYEQEELPGSSPRGYEYHSDESEINERYSTPVLEELSEADLNNLLANDTMQAPDWDLLGADSIPSHIPSTIHSGGLQYQSSRSTALSQSPELLADVGRTINGRSK